MSARAPGWAGQAGFGVRLSWGPAGIEALRDEVAVLVLVDVLRFGTALDVATACGAAVRPVPWPFEPGAGGADNAEGDDNADGVEVADGTGPRRLSLSPGSLAGLGPGDQIVLPSANGSHCSTLAAGARAVVVAACLRNAVAVARYAAGAAGPGAVGVVPCGERWPDGRLRPAVEDLIGAGAVVEALSAPAPARTCAPEAAAAMAAYRGCGDLTAALSESESGRELREKGLSLDVAWAAALNVSDAVPVLGADGAYRFESVGA